MSPALALDRRARHTKRCGGLGQGQMRDCLEPLERERASWSTQAFALRPGAFQAGPDALDDAFAFELSHGSQQVKLICAEAHISSYVPILDMWRKAV